MIYFFPGQAYRVDQSVCSFNHFYGGQGLDLSIFDPNCDLPAQRLLQIDLADPAIGEANFFECNSISLFFPFNYDAASLGYRYSDGELEILHLGSNDFDLNFPYESYPLEFDRKRVSLVQLEYEALKALAYKKLSEAYLAGDPLSENDSNLLRSFEYPFVQIGGLPLSGKNFSQVACKNPACVNYESEYVSLKLFCSVPGDVEIAGGQHLWEEDDGLNSYIFYYVCQRCGFIYAENVL